MSTTIYLQSVMAIQDSTLCEDDKHDADMMVCWECTKAFHGVSVAAMASARVAAFCDNALGVDLRADSTY